MRSMWTFYPSILPVIGIHSMCYENVIFLFSLANFAPFRETVLYNNRHNVYAVQNYVASKNI